MSVTDPDEQLWLGGTVDPATHERSGGMTAIDASDLTTHGVIVGMTGSGKTGLGIIAIEEALMEGIPCLVLDPKGDMGNLLLTFPGLTADEFEPWVPRGGDAEATADLWRNGLDGWGIGPDRIAKLRASTDLRIYTPGSTAATPINVVGDLSAPPAGTDAEAQADQIESYVSGLLNLIDIDADPLASREHILLSNLIAHEWAAGRDIDLGSLVGLVQQPPMRKLGVIELDSFFPASDRTGLAMRLNGLLASPSFAAWAQGPPLDIEALLWPGGKPAGAVVSLSHLSDSERQFAITLILSALITWMRSQPGSSDLRVLVYIDEVMGFVPPTAAPPAKKPILTILKQARAFGVGLVLSTQNPVDLDYKAISNAGTWMIGRLQTERDRDRLLDGMTSAAGTVDRATISATISGLDKREFVLHRTRSDEPQVFTTRWAMSYLAGPLTKNQLGELSPATQVEGSTEVAAPPGSSPVETAPAPSASTLADDETEVAPDVPSGVEVRYLANDAPWGQSVGAVPGGRRLRPGLAVTIDLLYDDTPSKVRHTEEYEVVVFPIDDGIDPDDLRVVDHDERDLRTEAPDGAVYVLPESDLAASSLYREAKKMIADTLYRERTISVFHNPSLKLYGRPGETEESFRNRCEEAVEGEIDDEIDKIRRSMERKRDSIIAAIRKAEDRVRELDAQVDRQRGSDIGEVAGAVLGSLFGGRSTRSAARRISSGRKQAARAKERLETAMNRQIEKEQDLVELEHDLADRIAELEDEAGERVDDIGEKEIPLDKSDIGVRDPVLIWIPT